MKLLLDENLDSEELNDLIFNEGHQSTSMLELGKRRLPDGDVIDMAVANGWVIVTHNIVDYRPIYEKKSNHPGLICLKSSNVGKPAQIAYLQKAFDEMKNRGYGDFKNRIFSVYSGHVHVYPDDGRW